MDIKNILVVLSLFISALGISGAVIVLIIKWASNIWAAKIIEQAKAKLEKGNVNYTKALNEKIEVYKKSIDIYSELLNNFDYNNVTQIHRYNFNKERMRLYGYMGLIATQDVMSAFDNLTDYLFDVMNIKDTYDWARVRDHSLKILNSIRKDIGVNTTEITYEGNG